MKIALIDPFFDNSHAKWAYGLQRHSRHDIHIYRGSAHHWKWKMAGGAVKLAEEVNLSKIEYDLFVVTDMLNLPLFQSLLHSSIRRKPVVLYFHENQISYPWSDTDPDIKAKRDHHYGWINYTSALTADRICFNSNYHLKSFLDSLPTFLNGFPERSPNWKIEELKDKSEVLSLGIDLPKYGKSERDIPIFIWNHRWEYDKNPELFFKILFRLKEEKVSFQLIVLGKEYKNSPPIFLQAKEKLKDELVHYGYAKSEEEYVNLLGKANITMVTSHQDFFGISVVEAIAAGCYPILPDRLAYREHISEESHKGVVYQNDDELLSLVSTVIRNKHFLRTEGYSNFVQKYNWQSMIPLYDDLLVEYSKIAY